MFTADRSQDTGVGCSLTCRWDWLGTGLVTLVEDTGSNGYLTNASVIRVLHDHDDSLY